jgi:hypothetical protein
MSVARAEMIFHGDKPDARPALLVREDLPLGAFAVELHHVCATAEPIERGP